MAETYNLTAVMDYQDGKPFDGYMEVRLNSASKTDTELVGPRLWQEVPFNADGQAQAELYPNAVLEQGTFYTAKIYATKNINGAKMRQKLVDTAFTMPAADSFLHDLAIIEPMRPSAEDVVRTIASEAMQAAGQAEAARDELSGATGRIGDLEGRADALETPLADSYIDGIFLAPPEEGTGAAYLNGIGLAYFLSKLESEQAAEYATKAEVQAVDAKASSAYHAKGSVPTVADLPVSGNEQGDVWNVSSSLDGDNYVWTGTAWDKLGGTVDLSPYAIDADVVHLAGAETITGQKVFAETILGTADRALKDGAGNVIASTYATTATATASVDGLMSAADKSKFDGMASGATATSVSAVLASGTKIATVTVNGIATDLYCETNTDTTYAPATQSADGLMASTDKVKLDGVEAGANAYVLPKATALTLGGVTIISDAQVDALFGIGGE